MRNISVFICLTALAMPLAASEVGEETRNLLDYQRDGQASSEVFRPLSAEQARHTHQRYVQSFTHPIPSLWFPPDDDFVQGGN